MRTKIFSIGLLFALAATPFISSAATAVAVSGSVASPIAIATPLCPVFSRSLYEGVSGSDVVTLQQYLAGQGYFNTTATGYFGPITAAAVAQWQAKGGVVSQGGVGSGTFGPLSRAYFARTCGSSVSIGSGGSGGTQTSGFSATPQSGAAPLTVQFISTAPQGGTVGTSVNFGDGTSANLGFVPVCSNCSLEGTVSHTYTSAGTYTATLTGGACACPANGICNCPNMQILGTTTVTVGSVSTTPNIEQINAPASVTLGVNGIAEIRNESAYFTLASISSTSATIDITPVGCWNSFPSDPAPHVVCMIAMVPAPPQTLTIGQTYTSGSYSVTLTQLAGGEATFSVSAL